MGFNRVATAQEVTDAKDALRKGARFLYGGTEGAEVIHTIKVHDTANCDGLAGGSAMLCILPDQEEPPGTQQSDTIYIVGPHLKKPRVYAHEWGHHFWNLGDEYGGGEQCTHSIMGNQWKTNNFCSPHDHAETQPPPLSTRPPTSTAFGQMATLPLCSTIHPTPTTISSIPWASMLGSFKSRVAPARVRVVRALGHFQSSNISSSGCWRSPFVQSRDAGIRFGADEVRLRVR